jgi:hypothetical protein
MRFPRRQPCAGWPTTFICAPGSEISLQRCFAECGGDLRRAAVGQQIALMRTSTRSAERARQPVQVVLKQQIAAHGQRRLPTPLGPSRAETVATRFGSPTHAHILYGRLRPIHGIASHDFAESRSENRTFRPLPPSGGLQGRGSTP